MSHNLLNSNSWHFISAVGTPNELKLYVNGLLVAEKTANASGFNYSTDFNIARKTTYGYDNFKGKIDEVRIYNRALSGAEIQSLYQNP